MISSGTSRSSTHLGTSYGGRSSYSVGGRSYAGSYRGYSYRRAPRAYAMGYGMVIIGPHGYGCYSCRGYRHSCNNCNNCYRRSQCGGQRDSTLATSFDRYELSFSFTVPASGSDSWPLNLTLSRAEVYMPRTQSVQQHSIYITFNTDAGDAFATNSETLIAIGWVGLLVSTIYMFRMRKELFQQGGSKASQYSPNSNTSNMGGAVPPTVYGHSTQPCTQSVATPMAAYPQTYPTPAYPTVQAYPAQAYPAQAYPAQACPAMAQPTYPASYPPSPPTTPPNKDE